MPGYNFGGKRAERMLETLRRQRERNAEREPETVLDRFAELICGGDDEANALTPGQAAERMGKSRPYGNALMQRLRTVMGPQAR